MPSRSRHSRTSRRRCIRTASRRPYSSSSMSPSSTSICSSMSSCLMGVSSTSCSSTTRCTLPNDQRMPATGPATGKNRSLEMSPMQLVRLLEFQLDVHEVVRRPRAGVLERQQVFVAAADFLDPVVERVLLSPLDQERGVEDHAVADDLVAAARDGDGLERLVNVGDIAALHSFERRLDEASELHAREVSGRGRVAADLVLESANLVVLALEVCDDFLALPEHLETELDLVLHL